MIKIKITDNLRERSRKIAVGRNEVSDGRGHTYPGGFSPLIMHWVGAIGELVVEQEIGDFKRIQPWVVRSHDTMRADFMWRGVPVEVECRTFLGNYKFYFVNVSDYKQKKEKLAEKLVCCTIDDRPASAIECSILGWIATKKIGSYEINWKQKSPAYKVPVKDIVPMERNGRMWFK